MRTSNPNLTKERQLLEERLLPRLDDNLPDYTVHYLSEEHRAAFQAVVSGERDFEEYDLPVVQTAEFGLIYPEYFISETDNPHEYGAAIEPHTKYIDIRDEFLRDALRAFAEEWKAETTIDSISLGRADVSKISFSPDRQEAAYSQRI